MDNIGSKVIVWIVRGIVKLKDRFPSKELLRERLGIDDIALGIGITAEQAALVWACAAKRR